MATLRIGPRISLARLLCHSEAGLKGFPLFYSGPWPPLSARRSALHPPFAAQSHELKDQISITHARP
ncbi:hypothetical protein SKAU_G00262570 [Synaphobranchus kaupii]|uniref:Uncharacterized protein n=1 Tax=Synaphobranchus kaupii TaxID=118154 RepID=A0A9Q1IMP3_SYNKA|nr:hypothetical protein SKAU_G00262570 [Synaphobranchus kaupii]